MIQYHSVLYNILTISNDLMQYHIILLNIVSYRTVNIMILYEKVKIKGFKIIGFIDRDDGIHI